MGMEFKTTLEYCFVGCGQSCPGSMNEPSFLSVAQRDRREEYRCPEGATERCERDFLSLVLPFRDSNEIPEQTIWPERENARQLETDAESNASRGAQR